MGFLKCWMMEDVNEYINIFGQGGIGTEDMIVCFIDRILLEITID